MIRFFTQYKTDPDRSRLGANAIEFALTFPVFLTMVFGIIEYGWVYYHRSAVIHAARMGCREGALIHPDDIPGPALVSQQAIERRMREFGFACDESTTECVINTSLFGDPPLESIECEVGANYIPLLDSWIPVPTDVNTVTLTTLELQR